MLHGHVEIQNFSLSVERAAMQYSICYINTKENLLLNHFTKGAIFICNDINSDLFYIRRYHVFVGKLTWYFIGIDRIKTSI